MSHTGGWDTGHWVHTQFASSHPPHLSTIFGLGDDGTSTSVPLLSASFSPLEQIRCVLCVGALEFTGLHWKLAHRSEITQEISVVDSDQVTDLMKPDPQHCKKPIQFANFSLPTVLL